MTTDDKKRYDVVNGVKHTVWYREEKLYISIFFQRCEVFISGVKVDQDPLTRPGYTAISRLATLAWKNSTLDEVVKQLRRSSETSRDLPGILADLLMEDDFE